MKISGGLVHYMGGCQQCHGGDSYWHSKNVRAVAALGQAFTTINAELENLK